MRKPRGKTRAGDIRALQPQWVAWRAVVLAVDTAKRSGWAVRVGAKLYASGECDTRDEAELDAIVRDAVFEHGMGVSLPVLVLERAWGTRTNTLLALGAARERWEAAWRRVGMPASRIVHVYPARWRARVLGGGAHAMPREQVRPLELAAARNEVGPGVDVGPDEAAAILISKWAAWAPEVGKCLPKVVRELSRPLPVSGVRR